jgi:carboxypeptidase D
MLYVDQPVGTGFSIGTITAKSQLDVSKAFLSWFKNFETTFGITNHKIFITGESYAGRYVPYIAAGMLDKKDTEYYDLQGGY